MLGVRGGPERLAKRKSWMHARQSVKLSLRLAYYPAYSLLYAGWLFHRSSEPAVFRYSLRYVAFLTVMASLFFVPSILRFLVRRAGPRPFAFAVISPLVLGCAAYPAFALYYYNTQQHLFDPFLQQPCVRFASSEARSSGNGYRVLALGGSTTGNLKLPEDQRYPSVLGDLLSRHYPQADITVLNAGMNWYGSKHSLINYVTYYRDWQPDLVIVMHGINDLIYSFSPSKFAVGEYDDLWTHFYGPSIQGANPPTFERYVYERYLRRVISPLSSRWYARLRFRQVDYPIDRYISLAKREDYLSTLVHCVKSDGADVLLTTQPSLYHDAMSEDELRVLWFGRTFCTTKQGALRTEYPSAKSLCAAMEAFNDSTKEVAFREGAGLVDAARHIGRSLEYFVDDVHYREQGARLLAEVIAAEIIKRDLLPQRIGRGKASEGGSTS
jgi:lysophospholipase L1-like esterase